MLLQVKHSGMRRKKDITYSQVKYKEIHMPNNSGVPFIMGAIFFVWGFSFVFALWIPASYCIRLRIFACMALRSFEKDHGHHISVKEIEETETKLRGAN